MARFPVMEGAGADIVTRPVPPAQQTMRIDRVFWSHFAPNLGPGGWVVGVLLVSLGLGPGQAMLAIVIGNLVGAVPVALAAAIGPHTGLPQMEASRLVLGRQGIRLPSLLNWLYCVGWDAVNNVPAATALVALLALGGAATPFWLGLGVLAGLQMAASVYGHHVVQLLQKYVGAGLLAAFAIIGLLGLRGAGLPHAAHAASLPTFVLATAILASFNLSWASYSSDYTRYLPANTPARRIVWLALAGLLASAIPFQVLGLLTASAVHEASPMAVITQLQHQAGPLGPLVLAAIALSSITGNSVNDTTASYSLISAGLRVPRVLAAVVTASLGYLIAVFGAGRYAELYTNYLVVTLYWIAPWIGIVLTDWYVLGGRDRQASDGWTGAATIFVVSAVLTVALFSVSDLYTGPVARLLGGADVGYYVGFFGAALAYAWSRRGTIEGGGIRRPPHPADAPHRDAG